MKRLIGQCKECKWFKLNDDLHIKYGACQNNRFNKEYYGNSTYIINPSFGCWFWEDKKSK